jgi:hypothetical protein
MERWLEMAPKGAGEIKLHRKKLLLCLHRTKQSNYDLFCLPVERAFADERRRSVRLERIHKYDNG